MIPKLGRNSAEQGGAAKAMTDGGVHCGKARKFVYNGGDVFGKEGWKRKNQQKISLFLLEIRIESLSILLDVYGCVRELVVLTPIHVGLSMVDLRMPCVC